MELVSVYMKTGPSVILLPLVFVSPAVHPARIPIVLLLLGSYTPDLLHCFKFCNLFSSIVVPPSSFVKQAYLRRAGRCGSSPRLLGSKWRGG